MDLAEYKAKELFFEAGIPIVKGITVETIEELDDVEFKYPVVVKAQVHTGGRGKKGGVLFAENKEELKRNAQNILGLNIHGFIVDKLLIVPKIDIEKEFYLSIILDRDTKSFLMIFSPEGGMDIEEVAKNSPESIFKIHIDPLLGIQASDAIYFADKANIEDKEIRKSLIDLVLKMYSLCAIYHCMLVELNPLVISPMGLIALDAKITIDDDAINKFPALLEYKKKIKVNPLVEEANKFNFLYIPCNTEGKTIVMSNGSGMLMTCIDSLASVGVDVKAVLDLGGGAVRERIKEAVRILFMTPECDVLFVNIFGGITRCDEVAKGIKDAVEEYHINKKIVTRLEGTNKAEGLSILKQIDNVIYVENLSSGINAVKSEVFK